MTKVWQYLKRLILSDSKESSKRFVFLFIVLIILTPLIFIHTNSGNFTLVLVEILGFLAFLVGGSIYQATNKK
jgi:hypothetical protein